VIRTPKHWSTLSTYCSLCYVLVHDKAARQLDSSTLLFQNSLWARERNLPIPEWLDFARSFYFSFTQP
jgi:hypothetical protein